jgi:hypothetical protein
MPSKASLFDRGPRDYICRSCLSALRERPRLAAPPSWHLRASSSQAAAPPQSTTQPAGDESERMKTMRKLGLLKEGRSKKDMVKVNYFEEAEGGKLRRLADGEHFANSLSDPGGQIASELDEMEKEFGDAKKLLDILEKAGIEEGSLSPDILENQLKKALESKQPLGSEAINALDDLSERLDGSSTDRFLISIELDDPNAPRWTIKERTSIIRLNNNLELAARQLDRGKVNKQGFELWKWWSMARRPLSLNWAAVPSATWDVLWDVFATESTQNPNRWAHIQNLARDMAEAGVTTTPQRQLMAIEAMFAQGWYKEALENHRRCVSTLGAEPATFLEFWQLGFRMHCQSEDLVRAERVADIIVNSPHPVDARILFPLIRAYARNPETVDKAYEKYQYVRSALGTSMTIEDYDEIISHFLAGHQTEMALRIFVEMMTEGRVQLQKSAALPPSISNEFFIGKWLKRLIGTGNYEGAYGALGYMKTLGVMPRPMVINVLLGAWLRSGAVENLERAETIAWAMINSRIQFVQKRTELRESQSTFVTTRQSGSTPSISVRQTGDGWPKATLETFSLLAENYKNRAVHGKMEELWKAFALAEIGPNTFFLNQMLFSLLQNGEGDKVADAWRNVAQEYRGDDIKPDAWTFNVLWQSLTINRLQRILASERTREVETSRELFAEMVGYASIFQQEGINYQHARNIMHTFRQLEDPVGMLVAYRALRQVFNLERPGSMALELLVGTTNPEKAAGRAKMRNKLIMATQRIEYFLSQRRKEMVQARELQEGQEMPEEVKNAEMADFLDMHLQSQLADVENADELFKQVAQQMGVYNPDSDVD